MSPPSASPTVASAQSTGEAERGRAHGIGSSPRSSGARRDELVRVPRPAGRATSVALGGVYVGGLEAVRADWDASGATVTLTGRRPFLDVTGEAGARSDGTLDGTVELIARVVVLGLELARARWSMTGWDPGSRIQTPSARLTGASLTLDLGALPDDVVVSAAGSASLTRDGPSATIGLPAGSAPAGSPLAPRYAELLRGLLGADVSGLSVHAEAPVEGAPARVDGEDLFFAPGVYGVDSADPLAVLDAAVRAALAGISGLVGPSGPLGEPLPSRPVSDAPPEGAALPAQGAAEDIVPEGGASTSGSAATEASAVAEAPTAQAVPGEGGAPGAAPAEGPGTVPPGEPSGEVPTEGEPAVVVELIMPEAPTELTPDAQKRGGAVAGGARGAKASAKDLPKADANADAAHAAVTEPPSETAARAREELAKELGGKPAPSPEIVALAARIVTAIEKNRPEDEDELLKTDPTKEAEKAGATITSSVSSGVDDVGKSYDALKSPPAGQPATTPTKLEEPPRSSAGMGVDAASAAPDPIPPENRSLDADRDATDRRIEESGIDTPVTREIPDDPFAGTRDAQAGLGEVAERTPAEIDAAQTAAIEAARGDMAKLQLETLAAMRAARGGTITGVGKQQGGMVKQEETTRDSVSRVAGGIYSKAEKAVNTAITPLNGIAMKLWEEGLKKASDEFTAALKEVTDWIDERHSGVGGFFVGIADAVTGLPGWVTRKYIAAERKFGQEVSKLLLDISSEVNGVLETARGMIRDAERDINAEFDKLAAQYPDWVAAEKAKFSGKLAGLSQKVDEAETSFVKEVSDRAIVAVNEAHAKAEELRQQAKGLIGRIAGFISDFIDDPVRTIINGLLSVLGIPPGMFWGVVAKIEQVASDIADDPVGFASKLLDGVVLGFQQFFDNFPTHLLKGFWKWLFGAMESPIPFPTDYSPKGLIGFALEFMGITWPRVREILVKHVGPEAVELLEAAWQLVSMLIEKGPMGIVEMIKEQLTPDSIVQMILDAAIEYIVENLIKQAVIWVVSLFNPASAILKAIKLIYDVCVWIFRNAARIFAFIQAVVDSMAEVVAGNIAGIAKKVEAGLALLVPPVIDLIAGALSLGDLPAKVAEVIEGLQAKVLAVVEKIIVFLVTKAKVLLKRLGVGEEEKKDDGSGGGDDELGTTVRFVAAQEAHRVWVQVAGGEATLMVASSATRISDQLEKWKTQIAAGEPGEDERTEAAGLVGQLETMVSGADDEADELAKKFLQANADKDDAIKPPSDDDLENRERAIAAMLSRLFTLFGGDEAEYIKQIAEHLPGKGAARRVEITGALGEQLEKETYFPAAGDAEKPLWLASEIAADVASSGDAVTADPQSHVVLLPFFTSGTKRRGGAESATFARYALEDSSAPHDLRRRFQPAVGDAYVAAMKARVPSDIDPADTQLPGIIAKVAYEYPGRGVGTLENLPRKSAEADPALVAAAKGRVVLFLKEMAVSGVSGNYRWARLQWAWNQKLSKKWLGDEWRGVKPRSHEWIPTNQIREMIKFALEGELLDPARQKRAIAWITFFNELRSGTHHVRFRIREAASRKSKGATAITAVGFGSHPGAEAAGESGRHGRGTIGQGTFHELLRETWRQHREAGPVAFGQALIARLQSEVWDGELDESVAPREAWFQPVDLWFTIEIDEAGEAVRVHGLTLAEVAAFQRKAWQQIQSDFTRALYSVDDE